MSKNIDIPYQFECRPYQVPAWEALSEGKKRVVCAWHRGAGKDLFALNYLIYQAMLKPGVYLHCFPKYSQGKKAIWNSVHKTDEGVAMAYLDHFPKEIIRYKNSSDMRLELVNGSIYCVMGIDGKNATQARGMNPSFVILSEYAYMDPESWRTIEPRISQNGGTALFLSTPNGQNHFYDLYNYAMSGHNPDYFASLLSLEDTKCLPTDHIETLRADGTPEDFIQQEYFCSFTRGAEGSYYGKQIQQARDDDRITKIKMNPDLPCNTAWDIGVGDSNAIWIFQVLNNGNVNILDYYENSGVGLDYHLNHLDKWRISHKAIWGTHYVPHDMQNREYSTGVDRLTMARNLGFSMTVVPRKAIDEGIQAVRSLLPNVSFNAESCKHGIKCLDLYRKKWNDNLKVYNDEPLHDKYSHGADAFRMLAVGLRALGLQNTTKLNAEKINEMRLKHQGY